MLRHRHQRRLTRCQPSPTFDLTWTTSHRIRSSSNICRRPAWEAMSLGMLPVQAASFALPVTMPTTHPSRKRTILCRVGEMNRTRDTTRLHLVKKDTTHPLGTTTRVISATGKEARDCQDVNNAMGTRLSRKQEDTKFRGRTTGVRAAVTGGENRGRKGSPNVARQETTRGVDGKRTTTRAGRGNPSRNLVSPPGTLIGQSPGAAATRKQTLFDSIGLTTVVAEETTFPAFPTAAVGDSGTAAVSRPREGSR